MEASCLNLGLFSAQILFQNSPAEKLTHARKICKDMHQMIKAIEMPAKEHVKRELKLVDLLSILVVSL